MGVKSNFESPSVTASVEDSKQGSVGAAKSPIVVAIQEEAVEDVRHIDLGWRSWVSV
jgi:hypothetical protein